MRRFLTPDTPVDLGVFSIVLTLPRSVEFRQHMKGALFELTQPENWEEYGSMSPDDAAEKWSAILATITDLSPQTEGAYMPIGAIVPYAGLTIPDDYLECNGAIVSGDDYPELYAVIHPSYKIPETSLFALPDLRSRVPIGYESPSWPVGYQGGESMHVLTETEMPSHRHNVRRPGAAGSGTYITVQASVLPVSSAGYTEFSGGGQAHNNMPPFHVMQAYIIRVR